MPPKAVAYAKYLTPAFSQNGARSKKPHVHVTLRIPVARSTPTFAAAATSEGVSSLSGDGTPLDGLKKAGKSSVPKETTGTPFVSST